MSQSLIIQPAAKQQSLFSLNMRGVDELFPGFGPGDFAVIYGSQPVNSITSLLCIRAQLPTQLGGLASNVVFIDGGNTSSPQQVSRQAQLHHLDPKRTLDRIFLSKAFTAYQMTTLIMKRLKNLIEKCDAKVVIISDLAGLFLDGDIPKEEATRVFSQVAAYLQSFARQNQVVIIATCPSRQNSSHDISLRMAACNRANVVLAVRQTMYDREFELEKHPRFMLGTAEFPSENLTLTDFMHP